MNKSLSKVIARALGDLPGAACSIETAARSAFPLAIIRLDSPDAYDAAAARLRRVKGLHVDGNRYTWGIRVM